MELKSDFGVFLQEIRPTDRQRSEMRDGQKLLRKRLLADADLARVLVSTFLQGSYRRSTAVRPRNGTRSDVDIVVVANLNETDYSPSAAMDLFIPFLTEHYNGKWRRQGRSFGIEMSTVDFDLVITSAPSEAEIDILRSSAATTDEDLIEARDWKLTASWIPVNERHRSDAATLLEDSAKQQEWATSPLRIPDRYAGKWDDTHPLEQIRWTRDKNARTNGHFVNVVKSIKWWRLENFAEPKHPKGFPLERIIGECCPDGIGSVAEGVVLTLEGIIAQFEAHAAAGVTPSLPDYGVPHHNVLSRIEGGDFRTFLDQVKAGAYLARVALDSPYRKESGERWRELLGSKFPAPPDDGGNKRIGYTAPAGPAIPGEGRFA